MTGARASLCLSSRLHYGSASSRSHLDTVVRRRIYPSSSYTTVSGRKSTVSIRTCHRVAEHIHCASMTTRDRLTLARYTPTLRSRDVRPRSRCEGEAREDCCESLPSCGAEKEHLSLSFEKLLITSAGSRCAGSYIMHVRSLGKQNCTIARTRSRHIRS